MCSSERHFNPWSYLPHPELDLFLCQYIFVGNLGNNSAVYCSQKHYFFFIQLTIPFLSVQAITKEKTALVIPNAIQISTTTDKYGFSSLGNRDMTYKIVFKCWQNVLVEQVGHYYNEKVHDPPSSLRSHNLSSGYPILTIL